MTENPGHGRFLKSDLLRACWAAIQTLDIAAKFELLRELATEVTIDEEDGAKDPTTAGRIRRAVVALRDAADILGYSPSQSQYRELRASLPELRLMSDATIRRALGNLSWNDCLRRALLDTVSEGDFTLLGDNEPYSLDDLVTALNGYVDEHGGEIPSLWDLLRWARDPRVQARPFRTPRSASPFERFGGYQQVLAHAGMSMPLYRSGRRLPLKYRFTDDELIQAVVRVARKLGRTPRKVEYSEEYAHLLEAARSKSPPFDVIPSPVTLENRFGAWPAVLAAAGLPPITPARRPRTPIRRRRPQYSREELLEVLQQAFADVGPPLTIDAYLRWRKDQIAKAMASGEFLQLPATSTIQKRLGGWPAALWTARVPKEATLDQRG